MSLATLNPLQLAEQSTARNEADALQYVCLTAPQRAFVSCPAPEACWVDGNAVGKSLALAFDAIHRLRGSHPYLRTHRPPVRGLVIGESYEQMVPLMEKLWTLAPKAELHPDAGFEPGRGITGKPPRLVLTRGPGAGSVLVFATYNQGASRVAGGQYHFIDMDEPPHESLYGEVRPRLLRFRGHLRIGMTPVPDMPDVKWLRTKVESKTIEYFNYGLKAENLIPEGYPAPWLSQHEIDVYAAGLLEHEREMRIRGAWDPVVTGRWLKSFSRSKHVRTVRMRDIRGWSLLVGMDHGTADGKQCAMLIAVDGGHTDRPRVAYLEETVSEGFTTPEHDADAVLEMLGRRQLKYDDVDVWVGDVPTGSARWQVRKSNDLIRKELARRLGRPLHRMRPIAEPTKHKSSMTDGMRLKDNLFARVDDVDEPMVTIDPVCELFIEACEQFDGDPRHKLKDVIDSGRYPTEAAMGGARAPILSTRY